MCSTVTWDGGGRVTTTYEQVRYIVHCVPRSPGYYYIILVIIILYWLLLYYKSYLVVLVARNVDSGAVDDFGLVPLGVAGDCLMPAGQIREVFENSRKRKRKKEESVVWG